MCRWGRVLPFVVATPPARPTSSNTLAVMPPFSPIIRRTARTEDSPFLTKTLGISQPSTSDCFTINQRRFPRGSRKRHAPEINTVFLFNIACGGRGIRTPVRHKAPHGFRNQPVSPLQHPTLGAPGES